MRMIWERDGPSWPNYEASRFVAAGGIRWHVQLAGVGPVLLLIHGTGASTHSWRDLLPLLRNRFQVFAVDLPGHGFTSSVPAARSSLTGMSDALIELLATLKIRPEFSAGHSAGAAILCRMAMSGGVLPRAILSINGAFLPLAGAAGLLFTPMAKLLAAAPSLALWLSRHTMDRAAVLRVIEGTGSTLDARGVDLYARLVRDPNHVAGALNMMANWELRSFERELSGLRVPLTLVVAENDRTVPPAQALRIQARLPQSSLLRLPSLGHLAHEEDPLRFAQICSKVFSTA